MFSLEFASSHDLAVVLQFPHLSEMGIFLQWKMIDEAICAEDSVFFLFHQHETNP